MSGGEDKRISDADAHLEREIRQSRKYTPQEALGRLAGPGALKGASAVSREQQAENEIFVWLGSHVLDPPGALQTVLRRRINGSEALLNNLDRPLTALTSHCEHVLASDQRLAELVREADVEWGRAMDERPHFQKEGTPPHPEDPYTIESVRSALSELIGQLRHTAGEPPA